MTIYEYLKKYQLITDGSFGTYYASRYETQEMPELANTMHKERVVDIHSAYIDAGARLIRTNTFASNRQALGQEQKAVEENIRSAVQLAKKAASGRDKQIFVAGDIGPIAETGSADGTERSAQYLDLARVFVREGIDILTFETFPDLEQLLPAIRQIKREANVFVMVQFCVNQFGYSSAGLSVRKLLSEAAGTDEIDAVGLNCGIGPAHMQKLLGGIRLGHTYRIALPNAGYPKRIRDHVTFSNDPDYFARKVGELAQSGTDIVGGCCGTNPEFIRRTAEGIDTVRKAARPSDEKKLCADKEYQSAGKKERADEEYQSAGKKARTDEECQSAGRKELADAEGRTTRTPTGGFFREADGTVKDKKLIAVELAPPIDAQDEKLLKAAHLLEQAGVDVVTFPDSPSGRTRVDSVLMAEKVKRETNLTVMPHICCRDKNAIAMRSLFLGAQINEIHNLLIVTGDPVPSMARGAVKAVFNFDAVGLMKIAADMNEESFPERPLVYGGAINQGRRNLDVEIGRVQKKLEAGAQFFLTQPVFTAEDAQRVRYIKQQTGARILCGIMPFISRRNALFMKNEIAGIDVTDEIIARYPEDGTRQEGEAAGIDLAKEVMELTKDFADGYYFSFPFNRVYLLEKILG